VIVLVGALSACSGDSSKTVEASWTLRSEVDAATTAVPLLVYVGSSSCDRFESAEVKEAAELVTITAQVRSKGDGCNSDMRTRTVEVQLDSPLGDRTLLGCGERPGYPGVPWDCRAVDPNLPPGDR
jgi:hypothetical protein